MRNFYYELQTIEPLQAQQTIYTYVQLFKSSEVLQTLEIIQNLITNV